LVPALDLDSQAACLLLTLAIEIPIGWLILRGWPMAGWRRIAAVALPSCLTHGPAWHGLQVFAGPDPLPVWIAIEVVVLVIEALLIAVLAPVPLSRASVVSIAANGTSAAIGLLLA
jgi:hypothetical protein